ncbi:MAG: hypothetical protein R6U25_04900, partial [Alkalispirochaeta sp.]
MNRKTTALATALLVAFTLGVQAQINGLAEDLQIIFDRLGEDVVPNLQIASVMNHELGSAELGDFPRMYFSFSAGGTLAPGVLEFTQDEDSYNWNNFYLLDQLLTEAGLNDSDVRDITDNYAPYPSLRVGYGVGLFDGYELSLQAGVVPQAVADLAGQEAFTANLTTIGTRLRKVLVRQDRGVPAISAGIGYVYSNLDFGYDLSDLEPLELAEGGDPLELQGEAVFATTTHSFGFDVRASSRFIRVVYPFLGFSAYYQTSAYEAGIRDFGGQIGTADPSQPAVAPYASQDFNAFNVVLNSGFDVKLSVINLFTHVNYALG